MQIINKYSLIVDRENLAMLITLKRNPLQYNDYKNSTTATLQYLYCEESTFLREKYI